MRESAGLVEGAFYEEVGSYIAVCYSRKKRRRKMKTGQEAAKKEGKQTG